MKMKILLLFLFSVASAQVNDETVSRYLKNLRSLTDSVRKQVSSAEDSISNARNRYEEMTGDRLSSLAGEFLLQKEALKNVIDSTVVTAINKKKAFSVFECISSNGREANDKLDSINSQVSSTTESKMEKSLARVYPFKAILSGFGSFVEELYEKKRDEMSKVTKEDSLRKIIEEVEEKMKLVADVVHSIYDRATTSRFQFFEDFVDFIFSSEKSLRKIQRDGATKISMCAWF